MTLAPAIEIPEAISIDVEEVEEFTYCRDSQ